MKVKNNPRRTAAFLLATLMLTMSLISACSSGSSPADSTESAETTVTEAVTTAEAITETTKPMPDLPECDFDGKEFTAITWSKADTLVQSDFYATELDGEPLNDALYMRNTAIEERYNLKLNVIEESRGRFQAAVTDPILAGEDAHSIVNGGISLVCGTLAPKAYVYDLYTLDWLNFDAKWWDRRCCDHLSIGGRLYLAMGDICTLDKSPTRSFLFNKKVAEDYDVGDLYGLARSGNWTLDAMHEMIAKVVTDVNGDGILDQHDRWGLMTEYINYYMLFLGSGELVAKKNENDIPYLTMNSERASDVLARSWEIMKDTNGVTFVAERWSSIAKSSIWLEHVIPMFMDDRALFYYTGIGNTYKHLREMETPFGIVPTPKYDEAQEGYYNGVVASWATCVTLPITNASADDTAFLLEALCCESTTTLIPAYFDIIFEGKAVRDEESIEMVDIILKSRTFDIGYLNNWGNVASLFTEVAKAESFDYASRYAASESAIQTAMEKDIEMYANR